MGETAEKYIKSFGTYKVPELLLSAADYWDKNPRFFSGSFEFQADEYNSIVDWFQGNKDAASKFLPFGIDGVGSLIAFWLYDDKLTPDQAPVAFLSSEGVGTTVIADNLSDYLVILTANRDYIGYDKSFYEYEEEYREDNELYRTWLFNTHKLKATDKPEELWQKAVEKHPDLSKWLSQALKI